MRNLSFAVAALFTIAAIVLRWTAQPLWQVWIVLIVAAAFLILGFVKTAQERGPEEIVLTEEQKDTLRTLKSEGNESGAIRQVHLWFRYASAEDAQRVVKELD
ncbi:hypothetical protein QP027_08555 [Corynebacterium breve]|uniref:Uncharacterized protein n=1 Tax=Corynebacterium breve TaxID=3049799 RepID=A0ABY8VDI9_9CORY|nr:hypothetical protein [Corynebacterium breve]WIM67172.1 hypothetical protein QP027_08555 [Corynebacterium breve]